jgi:hypothetical protein
MEECYFHYSSFVARLYNWCKSLGFEMEHIIPSQIFCSDESQGYPTILITKHFGIFPFNHGYINGIMAAERHKSHAHRDKDLLIVQASHVGYEPDQQRFGLYRRIQTEQEVCSPNCGKIHAVLKWYLSEYEYACNNIFIDMYEDHCHLILSNQYLSSPKKPSLVLLLDKMLKLQPDGDIVPLSNQVVPNTFLASNEFFTHIQDFFSIEEGIVPIGAALLADYFIYQSNHSNEGLDSLQQLEANLMDSMPWIVTSSEPLLIAAQVNIQVEFDRTYRSILQEPAYQGRNLLYVAGLNINTSPTKGQLFPPSKFVPWAAYVQLETGESYVLEQDDLFKCLNKCSTKNPEQISMEEVTLH